VFRGSSLTLDLRFLHNDLRVSEVRDDFVISMWRG